MATTCENHKRARSITAESDDSDVPFVRAKRFRQRRSHSKVRYLVTPSENRDEDKSTDNASIKSKKVDIDTPCLPNHAYNNNISHVQSPLGTQAPNNVKPTFTKPWDEEKFHLDYPHLMSPCPTRYTFSTASHPATGGDGKDEPFIFLPDTPRDDIPKTVFLHADRPHLRWGGRWARAKLAREVRKYERVKALWLFEHDHGFLPGYDDKHAFVAAVFARELESPWVLAWLRELIGEEDVARILAARERAAGADEEGIAC